MPRPIAIIAAMEREIAPLLRAWQKKGETIAVEKVGSIRSNPAGNITVVISGIGEKHARIAAEEAVKSGSKMLISVGLAGALTSAHKVGDVLKPATIIDGSSGRGFPVRDPGAKGVLVTAGAVLSAMDKEEIGRRYRAQAVDMEAAAVAEIADSAEVPFMALKAISDPVNFAMPPLDRFIGPEGTLDLLHLIRWAALRPATWRALAVLGRNSRKAAEELARELERVLAELH